MTIDNIDEYIQERFNLPNVGLNADWSYSAYCVGTWRDGDKLCGVYVLDTEDEHVEVIVRADDVIEGESELRAVRRYPATSFGIDTAFRRARIRFKNAARILNKSEHSNV